METVRKFSDIATSAEYDLVCRRIYPTNHIKPPFGSMMATLEAGGRSRLHQHHELETFVIIGGSGYFVLEDERLPIARGDVIYAPPFKHHYFVAAPDDELSFLSIWWESAEAGTRPSSARTVIFTPPPTPNGDLHLGHISGPYISADIIQRHLLGRGAECTLVVGTDKHQSYVDLKGKRTGRSARQVFDHYTDSIVGTFGKAGIAHDYFHDCDADYHTRFVANFIDLLVKKGIVEISEQPYLYCEPCERELYEAFVNGTCPNCSAGADGCICEDCGSPNNSHDLLEPRCAVCQTPAQRRHGKKAVLNAAAGLPGLAHYYRGIGAPDKLAAYLQRRQAAHFDHYVISFHSDWGMGSVLPGLQGQIYLGWFEMAAGYLAAIYRAAYKEESLDVAHVIERLGSGEVDIIHCMGADNAFFYAYLYPLIFSAVGIGTMRTSFVVNEFLLLDQQKFSTSRNHAIWANDVFNDPQTTDLYRFYLSLKRPESQRENYRQDEFDAFSTRFMERLGNVFARHEMVLHSHFGGVAPQSGAWDDLHIDYSTLFDAQHAFLNSCMSAAANYSVKEYTLGVQRLLEHLGQFQNRSMHYYLPDNDHDKARTSMQIEARAIASLLHHLACIAPHLAQQFGQAQARMSCA